MPRTVPDTNEYLLNECWTLSPNILSRILDTNWPFLILNPLKSDPEIQGTSILFVHLLSLFIYPSFQECLALCPLYDNTFIHQHPTCFGHSPRPLKWWCLFQIFSWVHSITSPFQGDNFWIFYSFTCREVICGLIPRLSMSQHHNLIIWPILSDTIFPILYEILQ